MSRRRVAVARVVVVLALALAGCGDGHDPACGGGYAHSDLLWHVAFGDAGFVAVGNSGAVATSRHGVGWEARQTPTGSTLRSIAFGGDSYVAVGAGETTVDGGTVENFFAVAFGAGMSVAVTSAGNAFASPDGRAWRQVYAGDAWL